ncbi:DUF1570 domain-containing protein [bacterium]|nr:DUF1570 domain-containing protein [bacterium]
MRPHRHRRDGRTDHWLEDSCGAGRMIDDRNRWPVTRRQATLALLSLLGTTRFCSASQPKETVESSAAPLHSVHFRDAENNERTVPGRVLVRAADGGLLLEDRAGRLWTVTAEQLVIDEPLNGTFSPLTPVELGAALIDELNSAGSFGDLKATQSGHYVVVSNTGQAFVDWTVAMLERLHDAFRHFWARSGFETHDPEFPLPVVILQSREQFTRLATFDHTPASAQGQGYFLITANRTTLVDLTASEAASSARNIAEVQRLVKRHPASVATVVHEATHQIAFNCGMHRRYADNPVWLTEGIAMYVETPDLNSRRGWQTIGRVNQNRLLQFRDFVAKRRKSDSLQTLLQSNARFAQVDTAIDAYSEAWALTHFLIKTRLRDFTAYLQKIAAQPLLQWGDPEQRLADFTGAFGDLSDIDRNLQQYLRRLA